MHRPRYATGFLLAPIVSTLVFFTLACGPSAPEKNLLDRFFSASKLRDSSTLGGIAMVAFNKADEGVVQTFSVVSVSEEQSAPLHLKALSATHQEAMKADNEFAKKMKTYQDDHAAEIKRVLEAEAKNQKAKGKDAAIQAEWDKWRTDSKVSSKGVAEAKEKMAAERAIADMSITTRQTPLDPTAFDGAIISKDYTISANILTPANQQVKKTLVITLQRVVLNGDKGEIPGQWIITKIKDASAAGTNP
jgi:hypothetical protein